jgi:hypothetical protein
MSQFGNYIASSIFSTMRNRIVRVVDAETGVVYFDASAMWQPEPPPQVQKRFLREWTERDEDGLILNWREEELDNGDIALECYADIRMGIAPLRPADPKAQPYIFIPPWPLDPNAPIIDDPHEWEIGE